MLDFPCCGLIPDHSMRGRRICFGSCFQRFHSVAIDSANTGRMMKYNVRTVGEYNEGESLLHGNQKVKNDTGRDQSNSQPQNHSPK